MRPDAGQPQINRVLEIFDAGERAPWVRFEGAAAEEHSVTDEAGGHSEPATTAQSNPVKEQEAGGHELGARTARLENQ